jgi:putative hydrolase of the HAD superfamily
LNHSALLSTVFFDLGGTLVWFDGDWEQSLSKQYRVLTLTLIGMGYPLDEESFSIEFQRRAEAYFIQRETDWLELTTEVVLRRCLLAQGVQCPDDAHLRTALDAMYRVTQAHWRLEHEALPTLRQVLKMGLHLGLISNAADGVDARQILKKHKLDKMFELVLISAEEGIRKPNPVIFEKALRYFKIQPMQAVMVGDWLGADILGAHNAGLRSVWLTRRVNPREQAKHMGRIHPDAVIENLSLLPDVLTGWMDHP